MIGNLKAKARDLLKGVIEEYGQVNGGGAFSCAVYDTAWVAMVTKNVDDQKIWLLPSSFQHVLDSQQFDGSWESYASDIDGIMNTMAALLCLCQHRAAPLQLASMMPSDIDTRISRAVEAARRMLKNWNVGATVHVGYEVLVPSQLRLLQEVGYTFDFPGKGLLLDLHRQKMSRFDPSFLYQQTQTSALHSLEAFIGKVDFDRLKHHKRCGSMLGSPSSTAAYLLHSTVWDLESENYLRRAIADGDGKGNGAVPSAFPSTNFEMIWIVTTLLRGGFTLDELGHDELASFVRIIESSLQSGGGLIGFAPQLVPDSDDTSLAIWTSRTLGRYPSIGTMIKQFEDHHHFKTYTFERNPSFTANCNVLACLLSEESHLMEHNPQIIKVVRFLCERWWNADQKVEDKWNLSPHYPQMLLSQSVTKFLTLWDQGKISAFEGDHALIQDCSIMLFQVMTRILQGQHDDGSWDDRKAEPSAYAILSLISLVLLPITTLFRSRIDEAILRGRAFLTSLPENAEANYIWIEKVTYRLKTVHEAYVLAALNAPFPECNFEGRIHGTLNLPIATITKFKAFYRRLPLFSDTPDWLIHAALTEGYLFLPHLRNRRLDIFPRSGMAEDKYFEYIPFTWTVANNLERAHFRTSFLREMMIISFLNYQADEYMETVVGSFFAGRFNDARQLVEELCNSVRTQSNGTIESQTNGTWNKTAKCADVKQHLVQQVEIYTTLGRFINHILQHPGVQRASDYDRNRVHHELRAFLLAHIDQLEDNERFSSQHIPRDHTTPYLHCQTTFFDWIRVTSADHTSCPYSFAFATCLLSHGEDFLGTPNEKYLAQAACRHLANLCRMYNDFGSLNRDRLEQNLNSVNFPEFHRQKNLETDDVLKERLFDLAKFERKSLELCLNELKEVTGESVMMFMRTFVNVTDMYGQIYVEKDIASRMK